MRIDRTAFGSITIDGQTYPYDVYILPTGKIEKRDKKNNPRIGGHRSLGVSEIKYLFSFQPETLSIGKRQTGILPIQTEAKTLLDNSNITIIVKSTPEIIPIFNTRVSQNPNLVAILHTTC